MVKLNLVFYELKIFPFVKLLTNFTYVSADFGVSAKNKNELQKRDSFIGTPYW